MMRAASCCAIALGGPLREASRPGPFLLSSYGVQGIRPYIVLPTAAMLNHPLRWHKAGPCTSPSCHKRPSIPSPSNHLT